MAAAAVAVAVAVAAAASHARKAVENLCIRLALADLVQQEDCDLVTSMHKTVPIVA